MFLLLRISIVAISVSPHVNLSLMSYESSRQTEQLSVLGTRRELDDRKLVESSQLFFFLLLAVPALPRRLFCFGSLVVLDVVCGYFLLFFL